MERRLAAIFAADIAGYSRLIGEAEEATVRALQELRAAVVPLIENHGGRIIDTTGDQVLAEFGSVVGAVQGAFAVQELVASRNADVPPSRRLEFRIGINQGEIVSDDGRVYGEGINVAARLQALAQPGGITISGRVHEDLAGKLDLVWQDAGDQQLKNIARPVRVWQRAEGQAIGPPSLPLPDRPSIAVLPFDNLSGQSDETVFSDGITEDIITGLARFQSLFVVARNSSFRFRGKPVSPAQIGGQLGVSYLLEGSVRRAGERIRITAQLIEAATGAHVWAERYDRSLDDIFGVQDDVATMIVSTLFGRIEAAKFQYSLRKPPESLRAYDFLLRGIERFRGYGASNNQEACRLFEQAIFHDARYALAHAYLALATVGFHGYSAAPQNVLKAALERARHAVELDTQEGGCHRILGVILFFARKYDLAEYHERRALELNPNDAYGMTSLGDLLAQRGHAEEGLMWIEKAMRLNPFHPTWYNIHLGTALYSLRRFEEAARAFERLPLSASWSLEHRAACYGQLGRAADAEALVAEVLRERPEFSTEEYLRRTVTIEQPEGRELLREGLRKAGLPE